MNFYFSKPSKTWLIVKPDFLEKVQVLFADSDIKLNVTDQGHKKCANSRVGRETSRSGD